MVLTSAGEVEDDESGAMRGQSRLVQGAMRDWPVAMPSIDEPAYDRGTAVGGVAQCRGSKPGGSRCGSALGRDLPLLGRWLLFELQLGDRPAQGAILVAIRR